MTIQGYKGFALDLTCRSMQYTIGGTYETDAEPIRCTENGFHLCEFPFDVWSYYAPADSRYCTVDGEGKIDRTDADDSKVAVSKLHIGAEIGLNDLIDAGVKFILDRVKWEEAKESQSKSRSAATNTGNQSAATNTGDQSAATNTGHRSAATNTGDQSAATNTGHWSAATNTGDQSAATNTGNRSAATNTGDQSAATNTGHRSAATNTGHWSAASVAGAESVAMAIGYRSTAKGALGCWLVLAEWDTDLKHIHDVQVVRVDGKRIQPDTWYRLTNGQFVEARETE